MKKITLLAIGALSVFSLAACKKDEEKAILDNQRANILFTNDVHCGFDFNENEKNMGLAGVVAYRNYLNSIYGNDNVSLIDCGDFIQGEPIGMFSDGKYPAQIMDYVGYDLATPGNHEFDYTVDSFIANDGLANIANTPYVSCNFKNTSTNQTVFEPYKIINYSNIKVAYIGITTPDTLKSSSKPKSFMDEFGQYRFTFDGDSTGNLLANTVQQAINDAKLNGADYIVGLSHLGIDAEAAPYRSNDIISKTEGFDIVLDAHSHSSIEKMIVKDLNGNKVQLASTGTKLQNLGMLQIDTNGTMEKDDDMVNLSHIEFDEVRKIMTNEDINNMENYLNTFKNDIDEILKQEIGISNVNLPIYDENGVRIVRNRNSLVASIITDSYMAAADADIAFVNGGGVRDSILQGAITNETAFSVQPFQNDLTVIKATGQEIIDALEFGAKGATKEIYYNDPSGELLARGENPAMLHTSGLKYSIDVNVESSVIIDDNKNFVRIDGARRVGNVMVFDKTRNEYVPIDLNKEYTLIGSDYIISSCGDGYTMFKDNEVIYDKMITDSQAFINYIKETLNGQITTDYVNSIGERITFIGR